jgi:hypothetical protein
MGRVVEPHGYDWRAFEVPREVPDQSENGRRSAPPARVMKNLVPAMSRAAKKPTPERMANNGLTCALLPFSARGSVAGAAGSCPPIAAIVVEVVVGAGVVCDPEAGTGKP